MCAVFLPVFIVSPTTFWLLMVVASLLVVGSVGSLRHR